MTRFFTVISMIEHVASQILQLATFSTQPGNCGEHPYGHPTVGEMLKYISLNCKTDILIYIFISIYSFEVY